MSFQQGLSGLNASAKNLDVIGNNVANASTVGFKGSQTLFSDIFAGSLSGAGGVDIGIGTNSTVVQQFSQGNITATNNGLDLAINGKGFFRVSDNGTTYYTRNGQFQLDKNGYVVTNSGANVTGYGATSTGAITKGSLTNLQVNTSSLPPAVTSSISMSVNLDATSSAATGSFDPADPATYTSSTSMSIYDSQGNAQTLSYYFAKTASNSWDVYGVLTNPAGTQTTLNGGASMGTLTFSASTAALTSSTVAIPAITAAELGTGAAALASITPSFTGTTQYGSTFAVNTVSQDGYASGSMTGFSIGADGIIKGRYSNGQTLSLGQVLLDDFKNPQGLKPLGNGLWSETAASGQPLPGEPSSGSMGSIQSSAVEESNVDLTAELVNMITAQRSYQASAQSIKTQDQVLQTLVNLR